MSIGKVNDWFARQGRWVFAIILVLVGVSFTLMTDVGRPEGNAFESPSAGTLGTPDNSIRLQDFKTQLMAFELELAYLPNPQLEPSDIEPFRQGQIEDYAKALVMRMKILYEAKNLGIDHVTDLEVADFIKKQPAFQKEKKYDNARYVDFRSRYVETRGITVVELENIFRSMI